MARELTPLAAALGRIPSGLYIVASQLGEQRIGFLASFVQQVGFNPPLVMVAVGQDRSILELLRARSSFTISVLDPASRGLMGAFLKRHTEGSSPFQGLELGTSPAGLPYLADALAWLECSLHSEHELPDHCAIFGAVEAGALLREGEPLVHLRKNGLSY